MGDFEDLYALAEEDWDKVSFPCLNLWIVVVIDEGSIVLGCQR